MSGNSIPAKEKEELYTNVNGMPYVATKDIGFDGIIEYFNGVSIPEENRKKFKISPKGATLICAEGGSAGRKVAFSEKECCFVNKLFSITPKSDIVPKFVFYYLKSEQFQNQFKNALHGLIGGVSMSKIKDFSISYPPLGEQQRIVAKLDAAFVDIDTAVDTVNLNIGHIGSLRSRLYEHVIQQKITSSNQCELADLVSDDCKLSYGIVQPGDNVDGGLLIVRPIDMHHKSIDTQNLKRINPAKAEGYKRTELQGHELLLSVRGSTGVVSIASDDLRGANVTRGIIPIRFNPSFVIRDFGFYAMLSLKVQSQIASATYGAALQQINVKDVRTLKLEIPSLSEQAVIVGELGLADANLSIFEVCARDKLSKLHKLKSAILAQELQSEAA
jgi:type I restriction enzyme S subunit